MKLKQLLKQRAGTMFRHRGEWFYKTNGPTFEQYTITQQPRPSKSAKQSTDVLATFLVDESAPVEMRQIRVTTFEKSTAVECVPFHDWWNPRCLVARHDEQIELSEYDAELLARIAASKKGGASV